VWLLFFIEYIVVFKVDGHDLHNAYHDEAVEVIRQARNPVRFVVKSMPNTMDTELDIDTPSNVSTAILLNGLPVSVSPSNVSNSVKESALIVMYLLWSNRMT
jgi:hypothetical protein